MNNIAQSLSNDWQAAQRRTDPEASAYRKNLMLVAKSMGEMAVKNDCSQEQFKIILKDFSSKILKIFFLSAAHKMILLRAGQNDDAIKDLSAFVSNELRQLHIN